MAGRLQQKLIKNVFSTDISKFSSLFSMKWNVLCNPPSRKHYALARPEGFSDNFDNGKPNILLNKYAIRAYSPLSSTRNIAFIATATPKLQHQRQTNNTPASLHEIRPLHTSPKVDQKDERVNEHKKDPEKPNFGEQMALRLINENGFLSWARNSYLSAAVGVGMLNGANDELIQNAGAMVLLVSAMNMAWGSSCHFTNLIRIRDRIIMSRPILFLNLLGTVVHALLWLFTIAYYLQRLGRKYQTKPRTHSHHHPHGQSQTGPVQKE